MELAEILKSATIARSQLLSGIANVNISFIEFFNNVPLVPFVFYVLWLMFLLTLNILAIIDAHQVTIRVVCWYSGTMFEPTRPDSHWFVPSPHWRCLRSCGASISTNIHLLALATTNSEVHLLHMTFVLLEQFILLVVIICDPCWFPWCSTSLVSVCSISYCALIAYKTIIGF